MNKAASPQPLHKIIKHFELMQSGKKKQVALLRPCAFPPLAENFARAFNSFYFIGTKFPIKRKNGCKTPVPQKESSFYIYRKARKAVR